MAHECPDSLTGKHVPGDMDFAVDEDEGIVTLVFTCELCGVDGSAEVRFQDIEWEQVEEELIED